MLQHLEALEFPPTVILRHRRENLKKCSLRGLEGRQDMQFLTYPRDPLPFLNGYVALSMEGPQLSLDDKNLGLLLIDGTWRYAEVMDRFVEKSGNPIVPRSLPQNIRTAYPRRQDDCPDPERGLASVEALYIAYFLMGRNTKGILDLYHWKQQFFDLNPAFVSS